MNPSREQRRQLERDNARLPLYLVRMPRDSWGPLMCSEPKLIEVWRSRDFLVQVFNEGDGVTRLSVNRTTVQLAAARWEDGITWDDLQRLKRECGRGAACAVEVYPSDRDIVDIANMRHLWCLPNTPGFVWRKTLA